MNLVMHAHHSTCMYRLCSLPQRRLEQDEKRIRTMLRRYVADGPPSALMLFPEGTDLSQRNLEASHKFSTDQGLPLRHFTM